MMPWRFLLIVLLLTITGCATQAPAPVDERIADEQVRAPAAAQTRGLQVFALRNPAVTDLSEAARQAESSGDLNRAAMLLERALRIEARDPELLQQMAELRLDQGRWEQAREIVDANDDAYLITMDEVTPDRLRNFNMDAFVNTGCPRITTDDGPRFHKPMLTPGEYKAAIGEKPLDSIEFDTFHDTW